MRSSDPTALQELMDNLLAAAEAQGLNVLCMVAPDEADAPCAAVCTAPRISVARRMLEGLACTLEERIQEQAEEEEQQVPADSLN